MAVPGDAGGGSNATMAAVAFAFLVGVIGVLAYLVLKSTGEEEEKQEQGGRRRGALDRMQRGAGARGAAQEEDDFSEDEDEDQGGAGRGNARKDAKKQERKAQQAADREAKLNRDTAKSEKQSKYDARQKEKDSAQEKKEEKERSARESKDKKEKEDFEKWKDMFAVEAEGEDDADEGDRFALEHFIEYVKTRKVVQLEDLAAEFRMRTTAAIDRIQQLEKMERLTGIFDDRGKFMYITPEEMQGVSEWMQQKGRVTRAELLAACNRIVRVNPTEEDKAKLREEAQSAAKALEEVPSADAQ